MEKRGVSQIDWAISLGVFLIFLTIFFILVHPLFNPELEQTPILNNIIKKFTDINEPNTLLWSVNKLPIYFNSSLDEIKAVSLPFPYNWKTENSSFLDNREFLIDEARIFFFHNLTRSEAWIVNSNYTYSQVSSGSKITCTSTKANTSNTDFTVGIQDGELRNIKYKGNVKADNMDLIAGGSPSYTNLSFICKYSKGSHDFYIMANNSIIFNYFDSDTIILTMDLADNAYTDYYDGSKHSIPYDDNCTNKTNIGILDFFDSDGIAFVSEDFNATFCYQNQSGTLKLNLSLELTNPYKIILHDGDYKNVIKYTNSKIVLGLMQTIKGLSYEKLSKLNQSRSINYSKLKESWDIPQINDFDWSISNKTLQ